MIVQPGAYSGLLVINPSKSEMQRVVAAAMLAHGTSSISNPGMSNDCKAAIGIAEMTGAKLSHGDGLLEIASTSLSANFNTINCGESGLGLRMFTPILATSAQNITMNGEGSLTTRPMHFFEQVLPQLGVECSSNEGKVPIHIKGPMHGGEIQLDGSLTSQFLTGLLMALPLAKSDSIVHVDDLKSRGYIDLTLKVLEAFGVQVRHHDYKRFEIPGNQSYTPTSYTINGDWSGAAFHLVGAAISGSGTFKLLDRHSPQPDKGIVDALIRAGAKVRWKDDLLMIEKEKLNAFEFDATNCPDLFPPLAALAANCNGTSTILGIERLTHKESDRAKTIQQELQKVGILCRLNSEKDTMEISGGPISGGNIHSHNDHRIAMMGGILALNAQEAIRIEQAQAINKSYPHFFKDLAKMGIEVG